MKVLKILISNFLVFRRNFKILPWFLIEPIVHNFKTKVEEDFILKLFLFFNGIHLL